MRILANYGHKNNGDSYNVTFEQMGDVPMDRAEETIDMLFKLAREAVQRQVGVGLEIPAKGVDSILGEEHATEKQIAFLRKLKAEERRGINIDSLSKQAASQVIKDLMEIS